MTRFFAIRFFLCSLFIALALWGHIDRRNRLIELQLQLPDLEKEVMELKRANLALQYQIDRFESPIHLLELAKKPEFGHLRYPYSRDVLVIESDATFLNIKR